MLFLFVSLPGYWSMLLFSCVVCLSLYSPKYFTNLKRTDFDLPPSIYVLTKGALPHITWLKACCRLPYLNTVVILPCTFYTHVLVKVPGYNVAEQQNAVVSVRLVIDGRLIVVCSNPNKNQICFYVEDTLPSLLSTGWLQERIRESFTIMLR